MASSNKVFRVGFMGLSSTGKGWAAAAHLPYLRKSPYYRITALCNSSAQSARKAAELNGLDQSELAFYGNHEELAKDENVDLVVCCVNVVQHYDLIRSALVAGKDVFCEWPLGSNLQQMEELTDLAEKYGSRTIVGLQGRLGEYTAKVQEYTGSNGSLGKILSSKISARSPTIGSITPEGFEFFLRLEDGGNLLTINTIHLLDTMINVLGGKIESSTRLLGIQIPEVTLVGHGTNRIVERTSHDHILVQGRLDNNVIFTFDLRAGPPVVGSNPFEWIIICEKGQISLSCPNEVFWMSAGIKMRIHDYAANKTQEVDLTATDDDEIITALQPPADNVARLYKAFATDERDRYRDFDQGLYWARFIDDAYKSNDVK